MVEVATEVDAVVGTAEQKVESSEVVRWEKFLPRMVLRVLLVEADDSTRQIIAAHLRKCSYKVAAVSDGLAAWETLKDRSDSVDLILTEVELPSISGFALLSLIMEHDICKNIPVIMMSSNDSISTVLKCMLKGAVDFLIKPVRRNELRNLWQHVWRRHTLPGEPAATEPKFEVSAESENGDLSNQWSNDGSSVLKNNEASDTQGLSQMKCMNGSDSGVEQQGNVVKLGQESLQNEGQAEGNASRLVKVKEVARSSEDCEPNASKLEGNPVFAEGMTRNDAVGLQSDKGNVDVMIRAGCNDKLDEPPTGAIDFIGSFNKQPMGTFPLSSLTDSLDKVEFSSQLDLSLRRSCFSSSKNQNTTGRHTLNHSDASAFSRYRNSKSLHPIFPTLAGDRAAMKDDEGKSGQHLECNNDTFQSHFVTRSDSMENLPTPVTGQSKLKFQSTHLGIIPDPGMRMHDMYAACKSAFPQADHGQKGLPPDCNDSNQGYGHKDEGTDCSIDQIVQEKNKQEPVGELSCSSPVADQSACISICNGVGNHENSSAHGIVSSRSDASVGATFAAAADKGTTAESFNDSNFFSHNGFKGMDTLRSSQREAALMKFRLKRKERCFEKKVRYQSRKRLAEQRPRVKGQFVRQVANDTPIADADEP